PNPLVFGDVAVIRLLSRTRVVPVEHDEMHASIVEGIIALRHPQEGEGLLAAETSVHVVITQHVIARAWECPPDVHETLVALNRSAEVTHLEDELDPFGLHSLDESSEALLAIVHDVLMDIGNQAKPQCARSFGSPGGAPWPGQQECARTNADSCHEIPPGA